MAEIKGLVHEIPSPNQVSEKLKKQELIIEYADNPQYPEFIKFEAINDKCDLIAPLRVGDEVEVHFNYRGRPWTDKTGKKSYFNSLQLWKVSVLSKVAGGAPKASKPADISSAPEDDDLPFN